MPDFERADLAGVNGARVLDELRYLTKQIDLGMRPETGKAMFIIPRTVGILGQLLEQDPGSFFRLQNDSIIYVGPQAQRDGARA